MTETVLSIADCGADALAGLLRHFGLQLQILPADEIIPGSYWGEREAGLRGNVIYARDDTPLHSALHEACHYICMDAERRSRLDRDAGGDYDEENAVCYLQIVLADSLPGMSRTRMQDDMDAWGYTFRLGSARAWFEQDADEVRTWLQREGLLNETGAATLRVRGY